MRTELKEGIFIEGFDSESDAEARFDHLVLQPEGTLYAGETPTIPEELVKECVKKDYFGENCQGFWEYEGYRNFDVNPPYDHVETAKQSIQSACDKQYCIIYKEIKP